jgi:hypothetical protein
VLSIVQLFFSKYPPENGCGFGCLKNGISGIKTDFKGNRGVKGEGKFGRLRGSLGKEHRADN